MVTMLLPANTVRNCFCTQISELTTFRVKLAVHDVSKFISSPFYHLEQQFSWITAKFIPTRSRLYETLHFLLDHPRRCFVYLFPAHQTWFLLLILALLK